jgi:hypothetical protein
LEPRTLSAAATGALEHPVATGSAALWRKLRNTVVNYTLVTVVLPLLW